MRAQIITVSSDPRPRQTLTRTLCQKSCDGEYLVREILLTCETSFAKQLNRNFEQSFY